MMMMMMTIRGRDGGTNFIFRIKEQETRLTLQEHGGGVDDDDDPRKRWKDQLHLEDQGTGNNAYPFRNMMMMMMMMMIVCFTP